MSVHARELVYTGRESSVPCVNATLHQSMRSTHRTMNVDRVCDRCKLTAPSGEAGEAGTREGRDVATSEPSPASSSLLPLPIGERVPAEDSAPSAAPVDVLHGWWRRRKFSGGTAAVGFLSTVWGHGRPAGASASGSHGSSPSPPRAAP